MYLFPLPATTVCVCVCVCVSVSALYKSLHLFVYAIMTNVSISDDVYSSKVLHLQNHCGTV